MKRRPHPETDLEGRATEGAGHGTEKVPNSSLLLGPEPKQLMWIKTNSPDSGALFKDSSGTGPGLGLSPAWVSARYVVSRRGPGSTQGGVSRGGGGELQGWRGDRRAF